MTRLHQKHLSLLVLWASILSLALSVHGAPVHHRRLGGKDEDTPEPTPAPTPEPTLFPSVAPSTVAPTVEPTPRPTLEIRPEPEPTPPTAAPTPTPPPTTLMPTPFPTTSVSPTSSVMPSLSPSTSMSPSVSPEPTMLTTPSPTTSPPVVQTPSSSAEFIIMLRPFSMQVQMVEGTMSESELGIHVLTATTQYLFDALAGDLPNTLRVELDQKTIQTRTLPTAKALPLQENNMFQHRAVQQDESVMTFSLVGTAVFGQEAPPQEFVWAIQNQALQDDNELEQALNSDDLDATISIVDIEVENDDDDSGDGGGDSNDTGLIVGLVLAGVAVVIVLLIAYLKLRKPKQSILEKMKQKALESESVGSSPPPPPPLSSDKEEQKNGVTFDLAPEIDVEKGDNDFDVDAYSLGSDSEEVDKSGSVRSTPVQFLTKSSIARQHPPTSPATYKDLAVMNASQGDDADDDEFSYGHVGGVGMYGGSESPMLQSDSFQLTTDEEDNFSSGMEVTKRKANNSTSLATDTSMNTTQTNSSMLVLPPTEPNTNDIPWDEIVNTAPPNGKTEAKQDEKGGGKTETEKQEKEELKNETLARSSSNELILDDKDNLSNFLRERRRAKQSQRQKRKTNTR